MGKQKDMKYTLRTNFDSDLAISDDKRVSAPFENQCLARVEH
jgi:hypothetical protein